MLGVNVFAADTDAEARLLFTSLQQAFVNLRSGRPGRLPPPVDDYRRASRPDGQDHARPGAVLRRRRLARRRCAQGSRPSSRRTGADELMVTAQIFDHAARLRSFEILAEAHKSLSQAA